MQPPFPNDDFALPNLTEPRQLFRGHAVHTAEHLRALLWVSGLAPDRVPPSVVDAAIRRLRLYRLPSGALLGDENVHGMPMPEAAYENCTLTELGFSLAGAVQRLGRADLGDWLETLAYNAVQGARLPDGRAIAYLSADTRTSATASRLDSYSMGAAGLRFKYSATHDDVACCCNPNAVRFLPQFVSRMWMRLPSDGGFAAVAYGPCELKASLGKVGVTILEETDYPFSDSIDFVVSPERAALFSLVLRRPEWAGDMDVAVPGAEAVCADGWYRIRKTWRAGDRVHVTFAWKVRSEPYANGEVAVLRGPLQYAVPLHHRLDVIRTLRGRGLPRLRCPSRRHCAGIPHSRARRAGARPRADVRSPRGRRSESPLGRGAVAAPERRGDACPPGLYPAAQGGVSDPLTRPRRVANQPGRARSRIAALAARGLEGVESLPDGAQMIGRVRHRADGGPESVFVPDGAGPHGDDHALVLAAKLGPQRDPRGIVDHDDGPAVSAIARDLLTAQLPRGQRQARAHMVQVPGDRRMAGATLPRCFRSAHSTDGSE